AQPAPGFIAQAERQERRLLELERVALLRVVGHLGERARHADGLERLLAQVVRLLGVERETLEGDLRVGHDERGDRADAELLQRLQTMVAVWRQVLAVVADGDDRIEEAADRLDDAHQPLDVRIRRIALVRRRLDLLYRKARQHDRLPAEWIVVATEHGAAIIFNLTGEAVDLGDAGIPRPR